MPYNFEQPPVDELDALQMNAINHPVNDNEVLIITGCPGSGKTTVINYRVKNSDTEKIKFLYIMWTKLLRSYIRSIMNRWSIPEQYICTVDKWYYHEYKMGNYRPYLVDWDKNKINSTEMLRNFKTTPKKYDQILIDEAQDLYPEFLSKINMISRQVVICCDSAQNIYEKFGDNSDDVVGKIKTDLLNTNLKISEVHLTINYRNTIEIYEFAKSLVKEYTDTQQITDFLRPSKKLKPKVYITKDNNHQNNIIYNTIQNIEGENIGILCPNISQLTTLSNFLKTKDVKYSIYHSRLDWQTQAEMLNGDLSNIILTTIQSSKGLEFDTVFMPFAQEFSSEPQHRRSYYVACTRAKDNLFILSSTPEISVIQNHVDKDLYELIDLRK